MTILATYLDSTSKCAMQVFYCMRCARFVCPSKRRTCQPLSAKLWARDTPDLDTSGPKVCGVSSASCCRKNPEWVKYFYSPLPPACFSFDELFANVLQRRPSITKLLENRLIQKYLQKSLDATMQKNEMPGKTGTENQTVGKRKPPLRPARQAKPMRPRAVDQPKVKASNAIAATRKVSEMDATRKV